jgi:flagellar biosynthesis protein FlhF
VILATRDVDNGMFRPKEIEVTAALPEAPAPTRALPAKAYAPPAPTPAPVVAPAPAPAPRAETNDELQALRASMEEMRRELRRMSSQVRMERELKLPPPAAELLTQLIARGVEDSIAEECVRAALDRAPNGSLLAAVRASLGERITTTRAPWKADAKGRRVLALVGPTGVGKTTTVAKIAARALMESKQKVALITVDTYRIGASEQLTRYGEIMNVPTFVARDRAELTRAMSRCANADLVLIDSAGRSLSEAVARQAEMLRTVEGITLCLTLSACIGAKEMAAQAERYRALSPERLLLTKVDEAVGPGSLLSASVRLAQPIVAVCDGQRVPEDIHTLSGTDLVELVLGDRRPHALGAR